MTNKALKIFISVFICAALAGCSSAADISYKVVEKSGYFTVGYDPSAYHTYEGYGLAVDIIKLAAQRMEVEAPIRPVGEYDWETYMKNDDIDVMLCKDSGEGLLSTAVFTDSILFVSKSPEEAKRVGVMDSNACIGQKNVLSYRGDYDFIYYSDKNLLLNDLEQGLVDAAVLSEYDALSRSGISDYVIEVMSETPVLFLVSANKQTFYDELSRVLAQMGADGTTARLKKEFIDSLG